MGFNHCTSCMGRPTFFQTDVLPPGMFSLMPKLLQFGFSASDKCSVVNCSDGTADFNDTRHDRSLNDWPIEVSLGPSPAAKHLENHHALLCMAGMLSCAPKPPMICLIYYLFSFECSCVAQRACCELFCAALIIQLLNM